MIIYILLLLVNVVLGVIAQMFLKEGVTRAKVGRFKEEGLYLFFKLFFNKNVLIGIFLYAASIITWVIVLTKIDLSFAYPMISLNYFFVALLSKFYFHEYVSWKRWLSIFVIIFGILVMAIGSF